MRRRDFIAGLGGAALLRPLVARAQQGDRMLRIGLLLTGRQSSPAAALLKGLSDMGYVEGRNVAFEIRKMERYDQLPGLAAELVRSRVAVIVTMALPNAAQAAKAATTTIPIVFTSGGDPVSLGLVASLGRPGGNITGISLFVRELGPKRLELLRDLVPQVGVIGILANPNGAAVEEAVAAMQLAARSVGQEVIVSRAGTADEIDTAFAALARQAAGGLLVNGDAFFGVQLNQMVALAARYRIPTVYFTREFVEVGGLMSYSDDRFESVRQAGIYVGRILNGDKPADLPVVQPTKFHLAINLKTAKSLGLTVPQSILLRADEVIE